MKNCKKGITNIPVWSHVVLTNKYQRSSRRNKFCQNKRYPSRKFLQTHSVQHQQREIGRRYTCSVKTYFLQTEEELAKKVLFYVIIHHYVTRRRYRVSYRLQFPLIQLRLRMPRKSGWKHNRRRLPIDTARQIRNTMLDLTRTYS